MLINRSVAISIETGTYLNGGQGGRRDDGMCWCKVSFLHSLHFLIRIFSQVNETLLRLLTTLQVRRRRRKVHPVCVGEWVCVCV